MIPFNSAVADEVRSLVQGADDSTVDSIYRELCQLADCSPDGCILLLQVCLDEVLLNAGVAKYSQLKQDLLSTVFRYCLDKPYFSTCFCEALRTLSVSDVFLETLSNELDLSRAERVGIGLALSDAENIGLNLKGQRFSIAQIEELCKNPAQSISNDQIHDIVVFLHQTDGLSKHMDSFTNIISLFKVKEMPFHVPVLVQDSNVRPASSHMEMYIGSFDDDFDSLLSEIGKEISMADIITELGYGCTADIAHCKDTLSLFEPLDDLGISKLLGAVVTTAAGLGEAHNTYSTFISAFGNSQTNDSFQSTAWDINVLVDSINEIAPQTNWTSVMENLDHEGFSIPDEGAFRLLMSIYSRACKDPFPLHAICGSLWKNLEGQLSFLKHAVAAPADTFTFKHSSRKLVFPDLANHIQGNQAWYCLDLLEVLCQLADLGYATLARPLLDYPLSHCPDVLLLGVSQINTAYNLLQYEVLSCVFPALLKDTKNSSLMNYLWHLNPSLTLRGFVDAHSDIICLLRTVDICQDLKILSAVLDSTPLAFSIKLATVSFRNDHSNLEKWITEKFSAHREAFIEECVKFLKESVVNTTHAAAEGVIQQPQATITNICWESCPLFIKVLQSHSGQLLTNQLVDELNRVEAAYESRTQSSLGRDIPTSEGGSDDIETQANIYFHQMFSEQISIDAMIQMLARFKESTNKRELAIFNCMISNLFEEYKFFPKYPDTQLKLAAVLMGSLIKHQLVAHLGLGVALRSVLDALRKSIDSKMFMFGTTALEQFMDRVIEWPQYCNHILQISHLRGTHAELVSAIEQALAKISSSQNEPNIGNIFSVDPHGSGSPSIGNTEVSDASWQFTNPTPAQLERPSSFPLQQRYQGFLGERSKGSTNSVQAKNILSISQPTASTPGDLSMAPKVTAPPSLQASPHHSATISASSQSTNFLRPRSSAPSGTRSPYTTGFGAALNIETLVAAAERRDTSVEAPPSEVQDKIFFMINNISNSNLDAKAREFNEVSQDQYYPWFAQYMVMKRASIEPNFHDLYLKFFDKVNSKALNKEMVKATYENCKALLQSDLIKSSSEERSLLKNLGSWLGKLTIGRNQTLRAKEIDPKILIVEAYERGLMIAVIPFTSKILEPCHSSIAYRPPNPWTMGILSLLAEIYNLPNLKMNLKFDIEVLFKNLSVDMKDVKPSSLLKDRTRQLEGNPDFSNKDVTASQTPVVAEVSSGMIPAKNVVEVQPELTSTSRATSIPNMLNQYAPPLRLPPNSMVEDDKVALIMPDQVSPSQTPSPLPALFTLSQLMAAIPRADIYFRINEKLSSLGSLQYSKIMDVALDKAIKEIIGPVIQRSVTIATRTTKELILKDLAMESDDSAVSRAAHLMVGTLAGSLAHVTSKEPLRVALSSHLRSLIQNLNNNSETTEQIVHILINDNLDLGCALIETVATRKAVEMIDGEIKQPFSQLRRQKELLGSGYYDAFPYTQGLARVPDALRPKPTGHLCASQQRVYEDFITVWHSQSSQNAGATTSATAVTAAPGNSSIPRLYSPNLVQPADLVPEESDHGTTQLLSVSTQIGTSDTFAQAGGTTNIASVFPPMSSNDIPVGESTAGTKDLGSMVPLSPTTAVDHMESVFAEPLSTDNGLDRYHQVAQKLEALIANDGKDVEIQSVIAEVPDILHRCVKRDEAALLIAQKVFRSLYENASKSTYLTWLLATLAAIRDVCKLIVKEITSWVIYSEEENKFNLDIVTGLIRSEILNLGDYDVHLAKIIDSGRNKTATEFAISLVQTLITQEPSGVSELCNVVDALSKLAIRPGSPESLQQLIEIARSNFKNAASFAAMKDEKVLSGRPSSIYKEENDSAFADAVSFQDQVAVLFSDWCHICDHPTMGDSAYSHYIVQLQQHGLLKGDDLTDRFFHTLTELAITHAVVSEQVIAPGGMSQQPAQQLQISYFSIDSYSKLVTLMFKYGVDLGPNKGSLLLKILSITTRIIQKDAEEKKVSFNPRPYFRLFINLLSELSTADLHDGASFQVLTAFANAFHVLQPLRVPAWSFAWLELVSHRSFMPKLLLCNSQKGWPFFQRLLGDLFKFMEPYLRNAELGQPIQLLYKGTLRVLLVLLHDFPEFLCDYHFSFCDVIPPSCIQMRNVILSAFPRNMRLPDPSTPNLKIDLLAEISVAPRIMSDVEGALKAKQMKTQVDEYLKRPEGSSFLTDLKQKLVLPPNEANVAGTRYNVPLINSLVVYVGIQAVQQLQHNKANASASAQQMNQSPQVDVFQIETATEVFRNLIVNMDTEGRYLLLNAIANQLRYPNNHTHYFSFIILYLFAEATQDIVQEQITRVLLERLIVNRPHPWGLLITFIELIKNPRYSFWARSFTRCAPEIERLFESVARSCGGKAAEEGVLADGGH
ncbi:CCR4-NOT transcription complex subunit 1-like isoform X2 [Triticum urartu]|uniref:CCR4-NOT transcription complex subunit 1 n=1 Tax=Triticum urartu TaxID=4572 RepID=A0A8R7K014_TRIUA|nr:CCR4-NOT transcription complex subunit 1-like isoform X2 [Triticum urartu]